jgi:hypothetical protein
MVLRFLFRAPISQKALQSFGLQSFFHFSLMLSRPGR